MKTPSPCGRKATTYPRRAERANRAELKGKLHAAIFAQVKAASKEARFKGFEMVKKLHLDAEAWTVDNGMLTPTMKMKRTTSRRSTSKSSTRHADAGSGVGPQSKL